MESRLESSLAPIHSPARSPSVQGLELSGTPGAEVQPGTKCLPVSEAQLTSLDFTQDGKTVQASLLCAGSGPPLTAEQTEATENQETHDQPPV